MIKTQLVDTGSGKALDVETGLRGNPTLIAESISRIQGSFAAVTASTATTFDIATPDIDGSLQLLDLIVSSKKANTETVTIRFTDDTVDIDIAVFEITVQLNEAIAFGGHWQGWKNARLELELSSATPCTVSCGYLKIPPSLSLDYSAWNEQR